ncbi:pectate lyase [Pseudoxanthomonas daejeonensis]|uniref:Pectate lyase n=1 Tax=Pseudoxanthomonas daejeonensis TaxID=266062 RepID=A0ABQ6ZC74_9GAMM|nr:pectate lyase [Pseudoxanthomonas daejeonensis]KAF1697626.1 pectate lyase [Pseudoxanthomonas daejeonensis]
MTPSIYPRLLLVLLAALPAACASAAAPTHAGDPVAENMLLLQTPSGGWSKHYREKKVDYARTYDAAERAALHAPGRHDDATLDNEATTREIAYLVQAHARTGNPAYLDGARRGVEYLLRAQYANGGWPQFYPDHSSYRHQITLNDDAMVHAIGLLQDIADRRGDMALLAPEYGPRAAAAVQRGLDSLLALQVRIDGQPTIWAAQYDETTLQPAKARAYELPSLAVAESVAVVRLLMRQPRPDARTVAAIESAARWLEQHRLPDLALHRFDAPAEETGKDVRVVAEPGASLWARFYDLERQQPLFVDRDSRPVRFADLPNERRTGYGWYGTWPEKLLAQELPRWRKVHAAGDAAP